MIVYRSSSLNEYIICIVYSGKWPVCILPASVSLHAGGTFPDWARFGCFAGELLRASVTALFSPLPVSSSSSLSTFLALSLAHSPSLSLVSLCIAGQLPFLSPVMSQNTTQKPLPFGYQFAAGAVAGVSEVCLHSSLPFSTQGSKDSY